MANKFKAKIWKTGNSHVVTIPSDFFEDQLSNGDDVEVTVRKSDDEPEVPRVE